MATSTQSLLRGVKTKLDPNPFTREGSTFLGWSTNKQATSATYLDNGTYAFNANTTLYAIWGQTGWDITYNMNGHGQVPSNARTNYTSEVLPYSPPHASNVYDAATNKSWLFNGWQPTLINTGETGNKTFTASWYEATAEAPGFQQVVILDVSGSMSIGEYRSSSAAITSSLLEYTCEDISFAKLRVFYGTYITNVQEDESEYIKNFDIAKTTYSDELDLANQIWNNVIKPIPKESSSEAMLTCLYFAIDKVMTTIESQEIGSQTLKAVNFLLLTDEDIFKFEKTDTSSSETKVLVSESSLKDYPKLIGCSNSGTYKEENEICHWLADWQRNTFGTFEVNSSCVVAHPSNPNYGSRFPVPNITAQMTKSKYNNNWEQMPQDTSTASYTSAGISRTQAFIN